MKLYSDEFFFDPSDLNKFLQNRTEQNRTAAKIPKENLKEGSGVLARFRY
jgi:hypothetical protein